MKNPNEKPGSPRVWPDEVKTRCAEHPAFTGGPMPNDGAPVLDGEIMCLCGEWEGAHRSDGTCELTGCDRFAPTETRTEYDAGAGVL